MAVKDYREMYISTILTFCKSNELSDQEFSRSYLFGLSFDELKELAERLKG